MNNPLLASTLAGLAMLDKAMPQPRLPAPRPIARGPVKYTLTYSNGTVIDMNSVNEPVGYTEAGSHNPTSKHGSKPTGRRYLVHKPTLGGYEIYAYPDTREFYREYTA